MNPSPSPSNEDAPLTAAKVRDAVAQLETFNNVVDQFTAYVNPVFKGMIGQLYGVTFDESRNVGTQVRSQFIDEFEADVQKEIKRKIK